MREAAMLAAIAVGLIGAWIWVSRNPPRHPDQELMLKYVGLQTSIQSRMPDVARGLLDDGLHPDPPAGPFENESIERFYRDLPPALQSASQIGQADLVRAILDSGADPNRRGRDGVTALYLAAESGHSGVVEVLIAAGADPALVGPQGTPAQVAGANGFDTIRQRLGGGATVQGGPHEVDPENRKAVERRPDPADNDA